MRLWFKKGYALVLTMLAIILLTTIGFGLYNSLEHLIREVKVQETGHIRGHYAALSGLRYAMILLQEPETLFGLNPIPDDSVINISLWGDYNTVANDIGLSANHDVTLVITKISDGVFNVSSTYDYY